MVKVTITEVDAVEIRTSSDPWPFASANRTAIATHFADLTAARPALFNGALWMLADWSHEAGVFRGMAFRTDYASFLYWRDTGFPDKRVKNCFGAGALHGADDGLVLGVMAAHTANAGMIYPPSGSFEDADIRDGRVDVRGNIAREIHEETGLVVGGIGDDGWLVVDDGPRIALIPRLCLGVPSAEIVAAIETHISATSDAELQGIHLVRGRRDIVPGRMQLYTQAYIRRFFSS